MRKIGLVYLLILLGVMTAFSQDVYYKYYQVADAGELNNIYNETGGPGWDKNMNWPVPTGVTTGFSNPYGVKYLRTDTTIYTYPAPEKDTGLITLKALEIDLNNNDLSGALPALSFDSLVLADFGVNALSEIGAMQAPELGTLYIYNNTFTALPNFNLPELTHLYACCGNLAGELPQWNTPKLEYVQLQYNNISAIEGGLQYSMLTYIDIGYNSIQGQLSRWETPQLVHLDLTYNSLTSVSDELDYQQLSYFSVADNSITGPLPDWDLPQLKLLWIQGNSYSGEIPDFNFPLMEKIDVSYNNLIGSIPDFNWPNLIKFEASLNQLSGELPKITAPLLETYSLRENNITGDLKNLDFPELVYLYLDYNDLNGSIQTPLDMPNLIRLQLDGNALRGSLEDFNMPAMQEFNMRFNNLRGQFPFAEMPELQRLHIEGNDFDSLPDFTSMSGELWDVSCWSNRLHFDDLLPYKDLDRFEYYVMQRVAMYAVPVGDSIQLSVQVKGTGNAYAWLLNESDTIGSDTNVISIYKTENPEDYQCRISNPMLPSLTLISQLASPVIPQCWNNGIFDICITAPEASWESGDDANEIQTTQPLVVNDFIFFEGSFNLDTVDLEVKINGKFYLKDILLPGGNSGNFTLAQGEYALSLAGSDGVITGFINDALSTYIPEIGGLEVKLDNLQLVGGMNATGVSLAFSVSFDNITPSCGNTTGQTTKIQMEGLEITKDGISVSGLHVADLGFAPGFCLKELVANYDQNNDKLTFGLTLLTPFIEVGGGLGFISGELDSIAMRAVLQNHIIPIGASGIGVIGCEGRINSITSPPWNMRFGGVFSSVLSDDLFQLTTSVEYIPPSVIKLEAGDGKFFNPPYYDDWWLMEGGIYGSLDLRSYKMKIGGTVQLAPYDDDSEKKFMGSGSIDLSYSKTTVSTFLGKFEGMITIPEISTTFPFDWLSARVGLPFSASGDGLLVYKTSTKFLIGNIDFGGRIGTLQYRIEFAQPYDHPDFFSLLVVDGAVSRSPGALFDYTFIVPEKATITVIKVSHNDVLPDVSLLDPDGKEISASSPSDEADLDQDDSANKTFWTLYQPLPGLWTASTDIESDVEVVYFMEKSDFQIDAVQKSDGIHVSWNPMSFAQGDSIDFFADDDLLDFNGTYLITSDALIGEAIIPNVLFDNECEFTLHVFAYQEHVLLTAYSDQHFSNAISDFDPPGDINVQFDHQTLTIEASWTPSQHPDIAGYMIELIEDGVPKIIAMPYSDESAFVYQLSAYNGQTLVFYAYGNEGEVSCASEEFDLIVTGTAELQEPELKDRLFVYPNPFSDICTIRIICQARQTGMVHVYTMQGVLVKVQGPLSLLQGVNEVTLSMTDMVPGSYFIVYNGNDLTLTSNVVLIK